MLKIASVSGAPPQTPLGELMTLRQTPSREELLAFGTRNLTYSHVLKGTPASRSEFSPPGSPYSIPGSNPVHEVCGVDELWIFLYNMSPPNLCSWALCYFMKPVSS